MRIKANGKTPIPEELRERADHTPETDVEYLVGAQSIRHANTEKGAPGPSRGQMIVENLRGHGEFKMTTEEVVALMRGPPADES